MIQILIFVGIRLQKYIFFDYDYNYNYNYDYEYEWTLFLCWETMGFLLFILMIFARVLITR